MNLGIYTKMGNICFHHNKFLKDASRFFSEFAISDLINFIGILVNAYLAYWIVKKLQDKVNNKRVLKDHFINETKELNEVYIKHR